MTDDKKTSEPVGAAERAVVTGRTAATPFALLGGVALVIWVAAAILAAALLLVWWLA